MIYSTCIYKGQPKRLSDVSNLFGGFINLKNFYISFLYNLYRYGIVTWLIKW